MMLVGDVAGRTAILVDDLADTCNTITRAAKLLKKEGATKVYALVTHGILSGDAIERIKASALDKVVLTNSISQTENQELLQDKLDVLEVGFVFAEVCSVPSFHFFLFALTQPRPFDASIMVRASACSSIMIETLGSSHHNTPALNDRRQNINLVHRQALFMALEDVVILPKDRHWKFRAFP